MRPGSRLGVPAFLLAAPILFFHDVCLGGRVFLLRDLFTYFYPWRRFAADSLARGEIPLWNPYSYSGTPFLANMQSGLLYPPNVVFWLLDFPSAMRLFVIIQFALTAWVTYALMRAMSCRPASSLVSALGYAYGGWMLVHVEFPNKLGAAGWLPLILLGVVTWMRGRPALGLAAGSLGVALSITAGYPQTTFTIVGGAAVMWACLAAGSGARRGAAAAASAASLPAIVVLGCLLAAVQIVPVLEALSDSAYLGVHRSLAPALSPAHFADLIYPHVFGLPGYGRYWGGDLYQFWLGHFYVGQIVLVLAGVALATLPRTRPAAEGGMAEAQGRDRRWAILAGLVLLVLAGLFCMGHRTPLVGLCAAWIPGVSHFRWLPTTSILIAFSLCWLSAFGMEALLDALRQPRRGMAVAIWAPAAAAAVLMGLGALASPATAEAVARAAASWVILPEQETFLARGLEPLRVDMIRSAVLAGTLAAAWLAVRSGRLKQGVFAAIVPAVLLLDLKGAAAGINPAGDPSVYREVPPNVEKLRLRPDPHFRIYVPESTLGRDLTLYGSHDQERFRWAADTLLFNLNLPHGLFSASDGDPINTRRMADWRALVEQNRNADARLRMLALNNVAVLLWADETGSTKVVEIPVYLPRAYVAAGARRVAAGAALNAMLDKPWDPYREVLVEDDFRGELRPAGPPVPHTVTNLRYSNNDVILDVECAQPGYLVLADSNSPGWHAFVDAQPAPVFTANHLFRGIELPAGRHTVRFTYRPASVRKGAAGSLAGLALLVALVPLAARPSNARPAAGCC